MTYVIDLIGSELSALLVLYCYLKCRGYYDTIFNYN